MNSITENIQKGTIGELLVQLRLLEHGVQAAPPIKDSGNDLIGIRGEVFKAIQVKTTANEYYEKPDVNKKYHIPLPLIETKPPFCTETKPPPHRA